MFHGFAARRQFSDLSEAEVLALAISSEEDDARIYATYAEQLRSQYPATAAMFDEMAAEEDGHRQLLIDSFKKRFGQVIPLIGASMSRATIRAGRSGWWKILASSASAQRPSGWRTTPRISTSARRRPRPIPTRVNCSAISPPPSVSTSTRRKSFKSRRLQAVCATMRTTRHGVSSC